MNEWSRQVKASLAEQEQVLVHQKEQIEKVKHAISKLYAEKQELLHRIELSYHSAKLGRTADENYSKDVSFHHKAGSIDKNSVDREPLSTRKASAKSQSQTNGQIKTAEEDNYITVHFNSKAGVKKAHKDQVPDEEELPANHNQLMKQVNNYEMDDESKKFLEQYLKEDPKPSQKKIQKPSDNGGQQQQESNELPQEKEDQKQGKASHSMGKPTDKSKEEGKDIVEEDELTS